MDTALEYYFQGISLITYLVIFVCYLQQCLSAQVDSALIVDFGPVRKERKRWEAEHGIGAVKTKAERRLEKTKKAEENARRAKEREAVARGEEIAPVEEEPAKKSRRFWK